LHALARAGSVEYRTPGQGPQKAAMAIVGTTEVYIPFSDLVNLEEEEARLAKEVGKVESELARAQGKLNNQQFRTKAKQEVVEKEERKAEELEEKIRTLTRSLKRIQGLRSQGGS
ncbi:MAG: valine--tRNA ligase, partial [Candidatus Binatia bacterium]